MEIAEHLLTLDQLYQDRRISFSVWQRVFYTCPAALEVFAWDLLMQHIPQSPWHDRGVLVRSNALRSRYPDRRDWIASGYYGWLSWRGQLFLRWDDKVLVPPMQALVVRWQPPEGRPGMMEAYCTQGDDRPYQALLSAIYLGMNLRGCDEEERFTVMRHALTYRDQAPLSLLSEILVALERGGEDVRMSHGYLEAHWIKGGGTNGKEIRANS